MRLHQIGEQEMDICLVFIFIIPRNQSSDFVFSGTTMLNFVRLRLLFSNKEYFHERCSENSIGPKVKMLPESLWNLHIGKASRQRMIGVLNPAYHHSWVAVTHIMRWRLYLELWEFTNVHFGVLCLVCTVSRKLKPTQPDKWRKIRDYP